jgi:hypothetical protein
MHAADACGRSDPAYRGSGGQHIFHVVLVQEELVGCQVHGVDTALAVTHCYDRRSLLGSGRLQGLENGCIHLGRPIAQSFPDSCQIKGIGPAHLGFCLRARNHHDIGFLPAVVHLNDFDVTLAPLINSPRTFQETGG